MNKIILASGSPRRKMLMEWAELTFSVMVSDVDESFDASLSPENIALSIAGKKNKAIQEQLGSQWTQHVLIAADTIVVLNNQIIGKPLNRDAAIDTLHQLAGNTHQVITAVDIRSDQHTTAFCDHTLVEFHPMTTDQITHYVDTYKPYDKAGAYAIQEWIGVVGIKQIIGDFYNVMGLPISRVLQALKQSHL